MAEYALVKISDGSLQRVQQRPEPETDPGFPSDVSDKDLRWHPVVRNPVPSINEATQVRAKADGVVGPDYVFGWTVRAKTQAELDADTAAAVADLDARVTGAVEGVVGKALFKIVNRVLALEGTPTGLTPAQFKTWFRNQQT